MAQTYSKNFRINLVLDAVTQMGSALPKDVSARVASQLGEDANDAAFLRAVYRDLKQLADEGRLTAKVFSSDGTPLNPDDSDTAKNIRIEYHVNADAGLQIPGAKLVTESGGRLIPGTLSLPWRVAFAAQAKFENAFSLMFRLKSGQCAVLQLPQPDFPAKILFCRESESDKLSFDFGEQAAEKYGARTLVFVCADPSVSRAGHCLLHVQTKTELKLQDLGSKSGTTFAGIKAEALTEFFFAKFSESTIPTQKDPFQQDVEWRKAAAQPTAIPPAALVRLGALRMAVLNG